MTVFFIECLYFVIITRYSVLYIKTNSTSHRLIDLVWINRMYYNTKLN